MTTRLGITAGDPTEVDESGLGSPDSDTAELDFESCLREAVAH